MKRKKPVTTGHRTLVMLRAAGFQAQTVERFNPFAHIRQDLFGVIDIIAVPGIGTDAAIAQPGIWGIQNTTAANLAKHRVKALAEPRLMVWLAAGGRFALVSWSKRGEKGKRKLWEHRWEEIVALPPAPLCHCGQPAVARGLCAQCRKDEYAEDDGRGDEDVDPAEKEAEKE